MDYEIMDYVAMDPELEGTKRRRYDFIETSDFRNFGSPELRISVALELRNFESPEFWISGFLWRRSVTGPGSAIS